MFLLLRARASRASSSCLRFFSDRNYQLPPGTVIPQLRPTDSLYGGHFLCQAGHIALVHDWHNATAKQEALAHVIEATTIPPRWRSHLSSRQGICLHRELQLLSYVLVLQYEAEYPDEEDEEREELHYGYPMSLIWVPKRYWQSLEHHYDECNTGSKPCHTHLVKH